MKADRSQLTQELELARARLAQLGETAGQIRLPRGASTARDKIWQSGRASLYHYPAAAGAGAPLLIIYSLINRPDILDFNPQRSVVATLRDTGHDVYLLDWGRPTRSDQHLELDDYVDGLLYDAIAQIRQRHDHLPVALLGGCQGGTLAPWSAALYPEPVPA